MNSVLFISSLSCMNKLLSSTQKLLSPTLASSRTNYSFDIQFLSLLTAWLLFLDGESAISVFLSLNDPSVHVI